MEPFATGSDLAGRLGRDFTATEQVQASLLLQDASAHLRGLIGSDVFPQQTSTFPVRVRAEERYASVGVRPLVAVASVLIGGAPVTRWQVVDQMLYREGGWGRRSDARLNVFSVNDYSNIVELTVTATHGYVDPPDDLVSWTCVLAAQSLSSAGSGNLSRGGMTAESIDDYSRSWTPGEQSNAFYIPQHAIDQLRSRYGSSAAVVETTL